MVGEDMKGGERTGAGVAGVSGEEEEWRRRGGERKVEGVKVRSRGLER